ncbi:tyrosine-type recombinase/integrase [Lysinibacillus sphaericus]|uniref:tyrosine-type recombinase/integrase n=1 Tax=Lysinibacillus sphaericus TaxID=1421 RepID=UPI003824CAAF
MAISIKKETLKNGTTSYKFVVNLGIPKSETKPRIVTRRGFASTKEAKQELKKLQAQAALGIYPEKKKRGNNENMNLKTQSTVISAPITNKTLTFQEVYEIWKEGYELKVESTTADKTMGYFKNHILPEFGKRPVDSITYFDCKQFMTKLTKKLKSSRKILFYFSRILKEAVQMDLISKNPMTGVELPSEKKNQFEHENEVFKENYYNREELAEFLDCCKKDLSPLRYTAFHLLAHSGLRKGELFALTWADVNFETAVLRVNKAVGYSTTRGLHIKNTKTSKPRVVDLDEETLKLLQEWAEMQRLELSKARLKVKPENKQLLFPNIDNELMHPSKTSKWIRDVQKKNNLREISTHGLRHTHCSLLFESGFFSPAQVMERLGHTDLKTTMKIYTNVTRQSLANSTKNYLNFIKSEMNE